MRWAACLLVAVLAGCGRVAEGTKGALNKGGEIAGTAATEVVEGLASGVEKTWSVDVKLSEQLVDQGLSLGKTLIESDSAGNNNVLVVYLKAAKPFEGTVTGVAFDEQGLEYGRCATALNLAPNTADYYTLRFQGRTDLERKSRVVLQ
ncbi:MAG: hypothetical protein IPM12_04200 [Flavobacteriales bacterium]|nr:hypothetical protein [Flavobacteriales bacterium]